MYLIIDYNKWDTCLHLRQTTKIIGMIIVLKLLANNTLLRYYFENTNDFFFKASLKDDSKV